MKFQFFCNVDLTGWHDEHVIAVYGTQNFFYRILFKWLNPRRSLSRPCFQIRKWVILTHQNRRSINERGWRLATRAFVSDRPLTPGLLLRWIQASKDLQIRAIVLLKFAFIIPLGRGWPFRVVIKTRRLNMALTPQIALHNFCTCCLLTDSIAYSICCRGLIRSCR